MGASYLLLEPKLTSQCETALKQMLQQPHEPVRRLAQWQLFRLRISIDRSDVSNNEIKRWESLLHELPSSWRAGPYYVLGKGHWQRNEFDLAAAAFLRLPLAQPSEHPITGRACLDAALALKRSGLRAESEQLLREVTDRFRHTPSGLVAKRLLESQ